VTILSNVWVISSPKGIKFFWGLDVGKPVQGFAKI
jgi:hypothetical protein